MMPSVGRLKTRPEFLRVAAARQKWVTPGLILQSLHRPAAVLPPSSESGGEEPEVRVGLTVSRKVGKAVERNRARRRLRAAAAEVMPVAGKPGHDYVLIGRRDTLTRPYEKLVADLHAAIRYVDRERARPGKARRGQRKEYKGE